MNFLTKIIYKQKCIRLMSASTIFSLSSGYGKCGVSVIRVSGPETKQALKAIIGEKFQPKPRYASLKPFYHPQSKEMIDKGLVLYFPGPASFTGEDSCEFQVHGSLAVISAMLEGLGKIPGLRPATPGEFTKRAFYGGKLDLTEVEGLADLIHAETEAQRKQALLQSTGSLSKLYENWRKRIVRCAAHLEAYIDFAEDENIEDDVVVQLTKELKRLIIEISAHLNDQRQGELLRNGVRTVIVGAPNVGKSSFLNLMCQRQISIVTPIAGTTRDIIETTHNFSGFPVIFSDTAGLRNQTSDVIELEGITKAKACIESADLILLLFDAKHFMEQSNLLASKGLENFVQIYLQQLDIDMKHIRDKPMKLIANKIDLLTTDELNMLENSLDVLTISCKNELNLKPFMENFDKLLKSICGGLPTSENPRITHARYRQQLERCIEHINIFLNEYTPDTYPDIAISAQKLRNALRCIERITGGCTTEDILDVVFADFCIGK
ncbi:tRNA modification GTPase GTPBP3, mitochondrial-like [Teleopsis dalmanni]|uniref:tRNA modification GTPase GTPBP3, mitochondrial-like n=1 Tax=Teleopsis dalmanni TaxID=139649 RepID=UPI0018CDE607|nr:tRNA modification GTPase GTPBP3, mitochondrial-like [Teleopsis dalmanni]